LHENDRDGSAAWLSITALTNDEKPEPPKIHSLKFDNVTVQLQALPRSEF
jgi:hypothetical protein